MQIFCDRTEDLQVLTADANYSWSNFRKEYRSGLTH